jgi:hypothetical protein
MTRQEQKNGLKIKDIGTFKNVLQKMSEER